MDGTTDLKFVTTDEMLDELQERCKGLVLVTMSEKGNGTQACNYWVRGGTFLAVGLMENAKHQMFFERTREKEDWEADD